MAEGAGGDIGGEQGGEVESPALSGIERATKIAPIPDSKFARPAKPLGDQAIDSVIGDSKAAKAPNYETEEVAARPEDKIGRERGEDGRFLSASGKAPQEAFEVPAEAPPEKAASLKFADREFTSITDAEKAFRDIEWHHSRATESALAWKAEAERLRAGGQAAPAPQPEPSKGTSTNPPSFDVDQAQIVRELALEAGKPELYDKWVIEEQERVLGARMEAYKAEFSAPIIKQQQEQQLYSAVTETWNSLKQYTKPDGSPAFPEVGNGQVEEQIGEYWVALGLPVEAMLNPASAMAAIGLHRIMSEGQNAPAPNLGANVPTSVLPTDADSIVAGASRPSMTDEPAPPEVRYLNNALNRSGYRIKGDGGRSVHLFDR